MIQIDHDSSAPPYEQIRSHLLARITSGDLPVGSRLPTVRQLASDLGLAANTVARAYHELETAGVVHTRGRAGTFVHTNDAAREAAHTAARAYAHVVRSTGLSIDEAIRLLRAAINPEPETI